jgi:hypothetical protein
MANVAGQAYIDFRTWYANDLWDNEGVEGFHFDEAAYENQHVRLDNSFEYYGQSETSGSSPAFVDTKLSSLD